MQLKITLEIEVESCPTDSARYLVFTHKDMIVDAIDNDSFNVSIQDYDQDLRTVGDKDYKNMDTNFGVFHRECITLETMTEDILETAITELCKRSGIKERNILIAALKTSTEGL